MSQNRREIMLADLSPSDEANVTLSRWTCPVPAAQFTSSCELEEDG